MYSFYFLEILLVAMHLFRVSNYTIYISSTSGAADTTVAATTINH